MSTRRGAELCDSSRGLSRRHVLGRLAGGLAAGTLASLRTARAQMAAPALTGRVVLPADRAYETARFDFNRRFDIRPSVIVYPKDTGEVGNAVRWARTHGLPLSVRSGGHSYEAFSLGPGLVIDLSDMHAVSFDPLAHTITAQPGVRLLDLYRRLWNDGVAISGGTCASVGLGGLAVGGGVGYLSRMWGLTADNVTRFEVVDADGRALEATPMHNTDLFWALRGGGASFGIVTEITARVQPIGSVVVVHLEWPFEHAAAVLSAWQQHQVSWPDELSLTLQLGGTPAGTLTGEGLFLGRDQRLHALLAPLIAAAPTTRAAFVVMPWIDAAVQFSGESLLPFFKAKSDFTRTPLPPEAIDTVAHFMARAPSAACAIQFQQWGGAISRVPADATAFPHRAGTLALMQYLAHWRTEADATAHLRWIGEFHAAMRPHVSGGAYSNMPDMELADWQRAYYGANFGRLMAVKKGYDANNVFRFAQSIPPA